MVAKSKETGMMQVGIIMFRVSRDERQLLIVCVHEDVIWVVTLQGSGPMEVLWSKVRRLRMTRMIPVIVIMAKEDADGVLYIR